MSLLSIIQSKCPRCYEGNMFENQNPYGNGGQTMHKKCKVCKQPFELETGFYWGAMYINYSLSVAIAITTYVIMVLIFDINLWVFIGTELVLLLGLHPILFRISRTIYLSIFVSYDPNWKETTEKS